MTAGLALSTHRMLHQRLAAAAYRVASTVTPWVDTAPNHAGGQAHQLLAPVLATHTHLQVATKVGHFNERSGRAALTLGIIDHHEAEMGHSISPRFLRWQIERACAGLRRDKLDMLFLHAPERTGLSGLDDRLLDAFKVLEQQVRAKRIAAYGVAATREGFTHGYYTVGKLDDLATKAGGAGHHLRAVQMPVNLDLDEVMRSALDGHGPIAEAAVMGWEVHATKATYPVEVFIADSRGVVDLIAPGATLRTASLRAVASLPGVTKVLVTTGNGERWKETVRLFNELPVDPDTIRKALDVLADGRARG
ncbi:aldo/keto reductase [Streptomyces sp. NPDC046374]|uniref:aldo/keto reductase n=1 Tax=Streptomyces sp. NPDC046374 TaxID=3154917 RepID=UPI0033CA1AB0